MKLVLKSALFLTIAIGSTATTALAQFGEQGIVVSGNAKKTEKPEFIRMRMAITSKGADTRAAIESIRERKKQASIKLERLEAIEDSIEFDQVSMGEKADGSGPNMQQMRRMMMQNFGEGEQAEKLLSVKPPVSVSVTVTADWKMPDGKDEDLLIAIQELKDAIAEADVGGTKTPDELTPEQQELDAELAEMMSNNSYGDESEPGAPSFLFGRRFPQSDADQLMQQAFNDAKTNAERLAGAASQELGPLRTLTSSDAIQPSYDMYDMYDNMARYGNSQRQMTAKQEEGVVLVFSMDPGEVTLESNIRVAFGTK